MTREMADNAIDVALAVLILTAEIIPIMKKCGDSIVMKDALSLKAIRRRLNQAPKNLLLFTNELMLFGILLIWGEISAYWFCLTV